MYENKKIKASIYKFFGHKHLLFCILPRFGGCLIFASAACFSLRSRYFSNQRFHISSSFSRISNGNDNFHILCIFYFPHLKTLFSQRFHICSQKLPLEICQKIFFFRCIKFNRSREFCF